MPLFSIFNVRIVYRQMPLHVIVTIKLSFNILLMCHSFKYFKRFFFGGSLDLTDLVINYLKKYHIESFSQNMFCRN